MKINRKDIQVYKAIFISFLDSPPKIVNEFNVSGMNRLLISQTVTPKARTLKLFFENEDDISRFVAEIMKECWIDFENYLYQCYLYDNNNITYNPVGNGMYEVQFAFSTIKMRKQESFYLAQEATAIKIYSTYVSPCAYYIEVKNDTSELMIDGHIIRNLRANDFLVFDGNNKTVKCNGENKFSDVILKDNSFPFLVPGINHIITTPIQNISVKLVVYPIWI